MEARAATRAIVEKGQHFAEVTVLLDNGELTSLLGPARRNRQEALKDCLELRRISLKCTDDPKLSQVKAKKKELEQTVWTVKDLGGRQLDGAEGVPVGYKTPTWLPAPSEGASPLGYVSPGKFRATVKPTASKEDSDSIYSHKTRKLIVEVAEDDIRDAVSSSSSSDWPTKAKVALQQGFKRFGPVLEVRTEVRSDDGERIANVRFASASAVDAAMAKAVQGWLQLGEHHVRIRQPAAVNDSQRKFVAPRRAAPALEAAPNKKKLRPNERFASKTEKENEQDTSEHFWDAQQGKRGTPGDIPPTASPPPEVVVTPAPERPQPTHPPSDASTEDLDVFEGEVEVAKEMATLLEKPFSQQKKALKSIRMKWHPDKNPEKPEVATRVFQFIQSHEAWLAHHEL